MRNFFLQMRDCKKEITKKRDREAAGIYAKVEAFLRSGNYSEYKKANLMVSMYLDGMTAAAIGEQLGMSEGSVQNRLRFMISGELFKLFGIDFFQNLSNYATNKEAVHQAMYRVSHFGDSAIKFLLPDVVSFIGSKDPTGSYKLEDCYKEMDVLVRYSRSTFLADMTACDLDKLKYLLGIFEGTLGTPQDWMELNSWLGFYKTEDKANG